MEMDSETSTITYAAGSVQNSATPAEMDEPMETSTITYTSGSVQISTATTEIDEPLETSTINYVSGSMKNSAPPTEMDEPIESSTINYSSGSAQSYATPSQMDEPETSTISYISSSVQSSATSAETATQPEEVVTSDASAIVYTTSSVQSSIAPSRVDVHPDQGVPSDGSISSGAAVPEQNSASGAEIAEPSEIVTYASESVQSAAQPEMNMLPQQLNTADKQIQIPVELMDVASDNMVVPDQGNVESEMMNQEQLRVVVQQAAAQNQIVSVPGTQTEITVQLPTSGMVMPVQQIVSGSSTGIPPQTEQNSATVLQHQWYQLPDSGPEAVQSSEPTFISVQQGHDISAAEYVQLPTVSMSLATHSDSVQTVETKQYLPVTQQTMAVSTPVQVSVQQDGQGVTGTSSMIIPGSSNDGKNVAVLNPHGQGFKVETSNPLRTGVVYLLTPDQSRVPTKASRKAFIPEGELDKRQVLIMPETGKDGQNENGQMPAEIQVIGVIEPIADNSSQKIDDSNVLEEMGDLEKEFQSDSSAEKAHKCHTCGESFYMYLELLRHVMSAHSNALNPLDVPAPQPGRDPPELYECSDCKLRFKQVEHLNEHIAMHFAMKAANPDDANEEAEQVEMDDAEEGDEEEEEEGRPRQSHEKKFACEVCDKKFTRSFTLKNHMLLHSGEKPFTCEICNKTFREQAKLKNHMAVHLESKPHICPVCAKAFAAAAYLRTHMMIHTGKKPYKCGMCDMAFISSGNLKRHTRVHTGEKPFSCDFCGMTFAQMGNLESHKRTHTGVRPYECEVCGKGFMQSSGLVEHIRTHSGIKPYSCDVCGRAFAGSSGLRVHKRTHTGEKPHECDICFKRFAASGNLKTHKKIHENIRPFKCEYCGKCFVASGNLTQHLRIHTGEKPHKCTICGKAFTGTGGLKIHMMGHYDEKPFMCEYCDKGFTTKQKLVGHVRSHTGERPFKCVTCDKAFSMSEKLRAHVKGKHMTTQKAPVGSAARSKHVEIVLQGYVDDDLGPPVLSPQIIPPIHAPPSPDPVPPPSDDHDPPDAASEPTPTTTSPDPSSASASTSRTRSSPRILKQKAATGAKGKVGARATARQK